MPVLRDRVVHMILTEENKMNDAIILIIEDDEDIREGVRILLEAVDYMVIEAENGEKGLPGKRSYPAMRLPSINTTLRRAGGEMRGNRQEPML